MNLIVVILASISIVLFSCSDLGAFSDNQPDLNVSPSSSSNEILYDSLFDVRDEQTYKTIVIGGQAWMAENLNYDVLGSRCYEDDPANCVKYNSSKLDLLSVRCVKAL